MELYEKSLLKKDQLGGIKANFGNREALLKLAEKNWDE
jgi:aldehyde:ferredoxin oxidoreductase